MDTRWPQLIKELLHQHVGLVSVRDQLRGALRGNIVETGTGLGAQLPGLDQVLEDRRGGEAIRKPGLQRRVTKCVHIKSGHIGDGEGTKERQPEAEGCAYQGVDVLRGGDSLLDYLGRFVEQRVLQTVQHEAGLRL